MSLEYPVVNYDELKTQYSGAEDILFEMLQEICDKIPKFYEELEQALSENDGDKVHKAAHSFKGAVANFQAQRLANILMQIEKNGRIGDVESAKKIFMEIKSVQEETCKAFAYMKANQKIGG